MFEESSTLACAVNAGSPAALCPTDRTTNSTLNLEVQ